MLHYNPRYVSNSTMLILRRSNCTSVESGLSPLSTGVLYGRLQRLTIPDAVMIQFDLLRMSIELLETCRGLQCSIKLVNETSIYCDARS